MKIAIAVFSCTGNTSHIASLVKENLEKAGHCVDLVDLLQVVKQKSDPAAIARAAQTMTSADCVGAAAFAWALFPPPSVVAVLLSVLKQSQIKGKPCFSFCTAGGAPGAANDALLDSFARNGGVPVGSCWVRAPENWIPIQTLKPEREQWGTDRFETAVHFAERIAAVLATWGQAPPPRVRYLKGVSRVAAHLVVPMQILTGPIVCDRAKCVHCGRCAAGCPYNALTMTDIEGAMVPVWDRAKCRYCCRCVNRCPTEAFDVPWWKGAQRAKYHFEPSVLKPGPDPRPFFMYTRAIVGSSARVRVFVVTVVVLLVALVVLLARHK